MERSIDKALVRVQIPAMRGRKVLEVKTTLDITVSELTTLLRDREKLPRIDSSGRICYDYSLRRSTALEEALSVDARLDQLPFQVTSTELFVLTRTGAPFRISSSRKALATFSVSDSWSVHGFQEFLATFRSVYTAIYAQNQLISDRNRQHGYGHHLHGQHEEIVKHMRVDERLLIKSISINSPGTLEVIGALNPLETIRKYLNDSKQAKLEAERMRVQKSKDDRFRDAVEQAKSMLEVESRKTAVAKERAEMLRDVGYSQGEIRSYVDAILTRPLSDLQVYQEHNQLECKSVEELDLVEVEVVLDDDDDDFMPLLPPAHE